MNREKASELIRELIWTEVKSTHECNSFRGVTKATTKREAKAISAIFEALTGSKPSPEEILGMLS